MNLAERIEAAGVDEQRAMLEEARYHLRMQPTLYVLSPEFKEWDAFRTRFTAMLDAEAYESAAMMLVPEGGCFHMWSFPKSTLVKVFNGDEARDDCDGKAHAATPALALAAAAIRAGAK